MDKNLLLTKLRCLNQEWKTTAGNANKVLEEMESLVEDYLQYHPNDVDMLMKLALIVSTIPLADNSKAILCLKKALSYDPGNAIATLILAYITTHSMYCDEDTFDALCLVRSNNHEIASMIEFAKSWYYETIKNDSAYEKTLLKSIELCDKHVKNYAYLGFFYRGKGEFFKSTLALQHALRNVKHVYLGNENYEIDDVNEFLDERLKGIHITESSLKMMSDDLGKNLIGQ